MSDNVSDVLQRQKQQIRTEALRRRDCQHGIDALSRKIFDRLTRLPEYRRANVVMTYLDFRSEVRTQWFLPKLWEAGKKVVVPYCQKDQLGLFQLTSMEELAPGTMRIPEPKSDLRELPKRQVAPDALDMIIVPGVAFDRCGARIGYGKGYYDRLLQSVRRDAAIVAICFECQLFPEIPCSKHDVRMGRIITESAVYPI